MWYVKYVGYVTLNIFLSDQALNSCESDTYDWTKELVVTTGGSSGISEPGKSNPPPMPFIRV